MKEDADYPQDRYEWGEKLVQACERVRTDKRDSPEVRVAQDKIEGAMRVLTDAVNGMRPEDVAEVMVESFCHVHRTLQASMMRALIEFIKLYRGSTYDLRNRGAVIVADKITKVTDRDCFIPYI